MAIESNGTDDNRVTPAERARLLELYLGEWERASRLLRNWLPNGSPAMSALTRAQTEMTRLRARNNVRKRVG